jgi:hypothetical protein
VITKVSSGEQRAVGGGRAGRFAETHASVAGFAAPPELLEPPPRENLREIDRDEAALVLDGYLYDLSRRESLCRLTLGRLADSLLRTRGYHRLGFARLSDYAVERLGVSGRELQSARQVWRKVEELPALARAYVASRINWTKLRLISAVVTAESVEEWLAAAERSTSRELERQIRAGAGTGASDPGAAGAAGSGPGRTRTAATQDALREDALDQVDGEPCAYLRIRCPARVRSLWRTVYELASRSSGSVLSAWQALEMVAAEAMSAVDPARLGTAASEGFQRLAADEVPSSQAEAATDDCLAELRTRLLMANAPARDGRLTHDLQAMLGGAKPADDLSPAGLDRELRASLHAIQGIDWQMGSLLRTFTELRLYRNAGYPTIAEYVKERLGISARRARGLVRLEADGSAERSELAGAYRTGRISWVRALVLLPILSEEHAAAWIERAGEVTVRRLMEEVSWASDLRDRAGDAIGMAPPPLGATLEWSDAEAIRQMRARFDSDPETMARIMHTTPTVEVTLGFSGPVSVMAFVADVMSAHRQPLEAPWRAFERMLLHAKEIWEAVPHHRNPVHERDGWRCRVPACGSRRNLQEHHLLFRSQGGDNAQSNRISICAWHHLRGIHRGILRAYGDATGEVRWQLGLGAGPSRGAFLSLRNDTYTEATPACLA